MLLLVYVHGYNLQETYLRPTTYPYEALTPTAFVEYLFSNGLLRFRIPMLFAISGFLFALGDAAPYGARIRKRLGTLVVPYLLWSLIGFGTIFGLAHAGPALSAATAATHLNLFDDPTFFSTAAWWEYVLFFTFSSPVAFQLWFLRALFFLNLMYPLLAWPLAYKRGTKANSYMVAGFFAILFLLFLAGIELPIFYAEGVLFFTLGIYLAKNGGVPAHPPLGTKAWHWLAACLVMALVKTYLAFTPSAPTGNWEANTTQQNWMYFLHKGVIVAGLVWAWYGLDGLVRACMGNKFFVACSAFSFFIYALHEPLLHVLMQYALSFTHGWPLYRLRTYILVPTGVSVFCMGMGLLLRTSLPRVYGVLTGSRGFARQLQAQKQGIYSDAPV